MDIRCKICFELARPPSVLNAVSRPPMRILASQSKQQLGEETNEQLYQHFTNFVSALPSSPGLITLMYRHDKGWYSSLDPLVGSMVADACLTARSSDIVVATLPKSGTTWIKALLYATVHRREQPVGASDHPFNFFGPHECVPFFEYQLYTRNKIPNLDRLPDPRLFATHVPFLSLPKTVVTSGCKVVYVCREPKDTLISLWHFANKLRVKEGLEPHTVEHVAGIFCDGVSPTGPYWDHILGYWNAHLARPEQVLFFKYEEMTRDPAAHVKRLAEFVGCPFSRDEEAGGVVDGIVRPCGFDHLSSLEVTKAGKTDLVIGAVDNSSFFRRGVVGDWENHLPPETARRIDAITEAMFRDSGLSV